VLQTGERIAGEDLSEDHFPRRGSFGDDVVTFPAIRLDVAPNAYVTQLRVGELF
jgi:hypothetical protein